MTAIPIARSWGRAALLCVAALAGAAGSIAARRLWQESHREAPARETYQPPVAVACPPAAAPDARSGSTYCVGNGNKAPPPAPIAMAGIQVSGRLPSQVVVRVLRQNMQRFRMCQVRTHVNVPQFVGVASVRFVIDRSGATASYPEATSAIADPPFLKCLEGAFSNLSFPAPDAGEVKVQYALRFAPTS